MGLLVGEPGWLAVLVLGFAGAALGCGGGTGASAVGGNGGVGGSIANGGAAGAGVAGQGEAGGGVASGGSALGVGGASAGASSSGGRGGADEAGGGAGGSGGAGGATAGGQCPSAVPKDGEVTCAFGSPKCVYLDCAGQGEVTASCEGGVYRVTAAACATFECSGESCQPGQICSIRSGGAYLGECIDNPCGAGPIDCACAVPECGTQCSVLGEPGFGVQAICYTCPSGMCA